MNILNQKKIEHLKENGFIEFRPNEWVSIKEIDEKCTNIKQITISGIENRDYKERPKRFDLQGFLKDIFRDIWK